ncbi:hypothetical protein SSTU70S_02812 [Stutzerimonas stutzeri]
MLITDYLVGRDAEGKPLCLAVKNVLPQDCQHNRSDLVNKLTRKDLVLEFIEDGSPVDWLTFPDLPSDVVELLESGEHLRIVDNADDAFVECVLTPHMANAQVG